jgi:LuxR family maltose regulon positive regulatory protein
MLILDGECEKALTKIDQLMQTPIFKKSKGAYPDLTTLVLRAWVCHKMGDDHGTLTALETALHHAEPGLNILPFIKTYRYLEKPLRSVAAKGTHREILDRVFAVCQAKASGSTNGLIKGSFSVEGLIEPLTERELEILRLLNSHLPTPEIADMLAVSVNTVRTHIKSIYAKLGVHSRTAAIDVSKKLKLLV